MKNIYRIAFYIDTGYEYLKKEAVVLAENEKEAIKKLDKWISPKLQGEEFTQLDKAEIEMVKDNGFGIIYQNALRREYE